MFNLGENPNVEQLKQRRNNLETSENCEEMMKTNGC